MTRSIFLILYIMPHGFGKRMSPVGARDQNHLFRRYPSIDNRQKEIIDTTVSLFMRRATANEQEEVKWTGNFSATTNRVARMGKGRRPCDAIPTYFAACHESWGKILRLRTPSYLLGEFPAWSYRSFVDRGQEGKRERETPAALARHCITK